ncbi:MAG TPA: TIR domain-containing protein [Sphingomicrobium sp.]|nr:TIR domain-containing protein [Sphingomicrobium sp.]
MAKLARLPAIERDAEADTRPHRVPRLRTRYYAFLSYSHQDKELADWLHRELERFRVPLSLAGKLTANGVVPRRLTPIFRDQQDLSAGGELAVEIKAALAASQFLVVLCSPMSAKSRWTNDEIENFKRTRPEGCVLAAVASGEPFASDIAGHEDEECFPPALRFKYDRRGHRTSKRAEPLAADFREAGEGKRMAFLKLVAGMLGVGLDELVQREQTRRSRRLAILAAGSLAGMAVTSTLALAAFQARNEAREQRREAEGLVAFMLGDLKDKLEPIGKLDALDGVGSRVLAYYKNQDAGGLTDAALLQRSQALSLMAEVASDRGDLNTAYALYREAAAGTAEAVRRNPEDAQRLYEHAQNQFYFADLAMKRGRLDAAESAFREYKKLADRMVGLQPDNMKWRMEQQNADANLALVLSNQRRFAEAATQWAQAFRMIDALTTANPSNRDYQQSLAESIAWYADAEKDAGNLKLATALREQDVSLLTKLESETQDVSWSQKLIPAERGLGTLYISQARTAEGLQHLRAAVAAGDGLIRIEPDNRKWLGYTAKARLFLADALLVNGSTDEASTTNEAACAVFANILHKDATVQDWRGGLRDCWVLRAEIAASQGNFDAGSKAATQAVNVARTVRSPDQPQDQFNLARAYRIMGDIRRSAGDLDGARSAWNQGLAAIPNGAAERLTEAEEHAELLDRVGRVGEAEAIKQKLRRIGYRYPTFPIGQRSAK